MSFPQRRRQRKSEDRALEQEVGVRRNDPLAERMAGGNTYSRADIEELERHHTRFWRRRRATPEAD